jgi:putative FmdB family regulatory protein
MPIYEFACPQCRVIFSFLSKRIQADRDPVCPKCGHKKLHREISRFAALKGASHPGGDAGADDASGGGMPGLDDPRLMRAMGALERDMERMDENNPREMAHVMRKMKDILPPGVVPRELDTAIRRLEAGEDPEKIEEDMGDVLGDLMGGPDDGGTGGSGGAYARDPGLYDF